MTEVRTVSSTGGEKGTKPERYDLIPVEALASVARLYGEGAKKYSEHNWRRGYEWSKSYAALQRHSNEFWKGVDLDPETGEPHLAAVIFHSLTLITFMQEHPDFDDRYARHLAEEQKHSEESVAELRRRLTVEPSTLFTEKDLDYNVVAMHPHA
ncbi:hypothetical protein QCN35_gp39 [Arthrobacter phage Synepsis]|uniref:dATP/dGTP diphosphohydrolase N-terminal domain-containing protein n=2 Tax=Gordonvirus TaxID=1982152 RepID=A0A345KL85_9CAUD|nr:hypothetical protein QCN34_gp42 [Arthrobacter phage Breylor17]YP_010750138.1 hypothetical protein QCN35_gp39 [Arthrobacter phage Synepsis]AXH43787.1 hypothetical protein SEA_BREYLOR17_42 [Arthrobacter phage Breylor17]AXH46701.1 hypothetical protein SEA_SYNEPSIS_39 [Arthrobacter phage Synepsis]